MRPTLLFLPGTLCDARVWSGTIHALGNDWPCAAIDYRFDTSIAKMAATALAAVDGAIIPVGLSMGGIVALEIWRQAVDRVAAMALFDTDPGADSDERGRRRDVQVRMARSGDFRKMLETQLLPAYFSPANESNATLHETVIAMALDQGFDAFEAQAQALATRPNAWPQLEGISAPTLVACGDDDRICLPETHQRMAELLPVPTLRTIAGAGHLAPLEQPARCTHVLRDWLNGLATATSLSYP